MNEEKQHPWHEFLKARANAIQWMAKDLFKTDEMILQNLSMDLEQVKCIREFMENSEKGKKLIVNQTIKNYEVDKAQ